MKITRIIPLRSKSIRKAVMLLGIYVLHLVFFQALMQAAPKHNIDNTFKPLFARQAKKHNAQPPNHPAVTYYTMLVKQGKDVGRVCNANAPEINETISSSTYLALTGTTLFSVFSEGQCKFHLSDATFKLYRLVRSFLI